MYLRVQKSIIYLTKEIEENKMKIYYLFTLLPQSIYFSSIVIGQRCLLIFTLFYQLKPGLQIFCYVSQKFLQEPKIYISL